MHVVRPYLGLGSSMAGHGQTDDGSGPDDLGEAAARAHRDALGLRYRDLLDHLPAAIYVEELEGDRVHDVSAGITELLGIDPQEWITGRSVWVDAIHPDDRTYVLEANERSDETGEPFHAEYRALHRDGREVWIRDDAVLVSDDDGREYWLGVMLDVTALVSARQDLERAQTRYGALVEQIPAIVYVDVADERMTSTYVSPQIREILGVEPHEYLGDPDLWAKMLHPEDREEATETYLRGRASGAPFTFEYRLIARDGHTVWFRDSAIVLPDADGRPSLIQGVMLDITERREAERQIAFLAYHDKLTGLPNRVFFEEMLELGLARARRHGLGVAVVAFDLDEFKLVNDSLGHEAGDTLLVALAERLQEATRETDLVARPGGDELLLLLTDLDLAPPVPGGDDGAVVAAESVAIRIQEAMRAPFEVDGTELYLTGSMGISTFPADADDAAGLMKNADVAMFRSKKSGRGGYAIHRAGDREAIQLLSLSTRLRKAVEQRSWALHYQPLVELGPERAFGVEALIRWPEPGGGLVPPGDFIPLAEEMGLIEAIGEWVLDELCRQDSQWRSEGLTLDLGFNLSPRQLFHERLVETIVRKVDEHRIDPRRVTVEITESTAMTDPDRTRVVLDQLHDAGIRLALDDFGTGYSSLARLRLMPVDVLKIDRTFVRGVDVDPRNASMVSAMVALASNLGMTTLAEGIETPEELRVLVERGCQLGQGFLFSRPIPGDEILAAHRRAGLRALTGGAADASESA